MPLRIDQLEPPAGLTTGDELVTLRGEIPERVSVWFGPVQVRPTDRVREESGTVVMHVRTPRFGPAVVDVTVRALDELGEPIFGEKVTLPAAFRFERLRLGVESDLTRLVRTLLRELKRQVLENSSIAVSVEYPEDPEAVLAKITDAKLPSLVLSGPRVRPNRTYATNEPSEQLVYGIAGPELRRRRPALTVDLEFGITIATDRSAEMLNLQSSLARFLHANASLSMARDPAHPDAGLVGWELDPSGELRPLVEGTERSDLRAFSWGLVIRGFDLAEDQLLDVGRAVERAAELEIEPFVPSP